MVRKGLCLCLIVGACAALSTVATAAVVNPTIPCVGTPPGAVGVNVCSDGESPDHDARIRADVNALFARDTVRIERVMPSATYRRWLVENDYMILLANGSAYVTQERNGTVQTTLVHAGLSAGFANVSVDYTKAVNDGISCRNDVRVFAVAYPPLPTGPIAQNQDEDLPCAPLPDLP